MRFRWFFGLLLLAGLARALPTAAPVTLADGGQPLRQVVTSPEADPTTRTAARELAEMLTRICGGTFAVAAGDGHTGLAVGVPADFPTLGPVENLSADDPLRRDDYLLRTHKDGVLLLGATPLAARLAVWDLLARLGYRRFFPSKTWEVVPASPILRLTADALERPDYAARRIWYGYGTWPENKPLYDEWCLRNRAAGSFTLNTGHAYDGIIAKNKATFAAHPEFFALVQGQRKPSKFCIANPELRTLVVEYAVKAFEAAPGLDSISLDPSDGGGWCGCEECAQLGSVSDRVTLLAAEAAEAVTRRFGQRYIGMYAYHE
ncbi:MAG TPA: DUF4838 domain-containing protein, partial [Armatimonadota bacterium]|nr:DUF4838 domain-containing protein [Armatimonadota bacterium]